jgi:hypothetical protein
MDSRDSIHIDTADRAIFRKNFAEQGKGFPKTVRFPDTWRQGRFNGSCNDRW